MDIKEIAEILLLLRLNVGCSIQVQYKHHDSNKLKYYSGQILKFMKKYKKGIKASIKFDDNTSNVISLPYEEHGKTWILYK
jgi:hypothetical protein